MSEHQDNLDDSSASLDTALKVAFGLGSPRTPRSDDAVPSADRPVPQQIARYQIERLLGTGGFGTVYLGRDPSLGRLVAIKVPHKRLVSADPESFLAEAKLLAMLNHPNILPVYDVGSTDDFPCFIVSKFVAGSLTRYLRERSLTRTEAAKLSAMVADALHHAHKRSLVHRDIKPGNLLLDDDRQVYIADFGIAIREDLGRPVDRHIGTPAYTSPEQARGEGHRVDGRSDIYSLGVVLYEMITGRRPFRAENKSELLQLVIDAEPKPPRQIDETIPQELERICLRAMSRRVRDRYTTAHDFAEDLRQFLAEHDSSTAPPRMVSDHLPTPSVKVTAKSNSDESAQVATVVPKGLRAFDRYDAEFFLQLLPGPRDRHGVPESVRFWKHKVEETDAVSTFSVGLIYGPSGCGKSSLVKAGLIPWLSEDILPLFIEATPTGTEEQLLTAIRRRFSWLPEDADLAETVALLRTAENQSPRKVLIVLDQFEQWLHTADTEQRTGLADALRQCDGTRVQCLLLVRDDFWMATTRFFRQLEIRLVEGGNAAAIDLFPVAHALKVLASFGQAYGELPDSTAALSGEQETFLRRAIDGLADNGKVICVRLALFAEMMKDKPWTPATLVSVGGAEGIGVVFLDSTFSSPGASPACRHHQQAARSVVRALLPESQIDIKGVRQSHSALLEASGYAHRPAEFEELIRLLDAELRLITPIDADLDATSLDRRTGLQSRSTRETQNGMGSESRPTHLETELENGPREKTYQLTHDYLVPSAREWLTQKQRETRRGRAELCLAEQSTLWNARPQTRFLPGWLEYLRILLLTRRRGWTEPQRQMMRSARTYYGLRSSLLVFLTVLVVIAGMSVRANVLRRQEKISRQNEVRNAKSLVNSVLTAPPHAIPRLLVDLESLEDHALPLLRDRFNDPQLDETSRLAAAAALAQFGEVETRFFVDALREAIPGNCQNIVNALEKQRARSNDQLLMAFKTSKETEYQARLATILLHFGEPEPAQSMLEQISDNPESRTRFIAVFPTWYVGWEGFIDFLGSCDSPATISGLCCALAEVPAKEIPIEVRESLKPVMTDLARNHSDPAVHSAAGLVLKRWLVDPQLDETLRTHQENVQARINEEFRRANRNLTHALSKPWSPVDGQVRSVKRLSAELEQITKQRSWYVNSLGMTMIRVREPYGQAYGMSVSDREISLREFQEFVKDAGVNWRHHERQTSPTRNHPVQRVNFGDAVGFCNWLSAREGLTVCYQRANNAWQRDKAANGYRLPEFTEWSFVCRASTTTAFSCGDDYEELRRYAHIASSESTICGSKLPNAWGFFDLHGNLSEWCEDLHWEDDAWYSETRGGHFSSPPHDLSTGGRSAQLETYRGHNLGFRVARSHLPPKTAIEDLPSTSVAAELIYLEDVTASFDQEPHEARLRQIEAARKALEPNLVSFTSIDEKLERPLGSVEWTLANADGAVDYRARVATFVDFAANQTDTEIADRLLLYAQARLAQLEGNHEVALETFQTLTARVMRPEPLLRMIQCQRTLGKPISDSLDQAVSRFPNCPELWQMWLDHSMNDLGKSPADLIASMEGVPPAVRELPTPAAIHWLLKNLREEQPVRIDCGARGGGLVEGVEWSADAFYVGGHIDTFVQAVIGCDDPTMYKSIHSFGDTGGAYRVPLPNGAYRVTLFFCEGWYQPREYNVRIEGDTVLSNFTPLAAGHSVAHSKQFEVKLQDGLLNIDFLPMLFYADINGICIERVDTE